jgi:glycosyltransferase involved in cell wall biosynthesis
MVIDGGSKDGSVEIIKKYADRLAYWVSEPDKGPADAINKGFAHSNGEIMGWINSSDVQYPWTLKTVAQVFMDLPEAQWITGIATHLGDGAAPQDISIHYRNLYDFLSGDYAWLQQESTFWRRTLWDAAGGGLDVSMRVVFEFELWLRFFKRAELYNVNTILGGYRQHEERIGGAPSDDSKRRRIAAERFATFYQSFGGRDRRRAGLIRLTKRPSWWVLSSALKKVGLMNWYSHLVVRRDLDARKWMVTRNQDVYL